MDQGKLKKQTITRAFIAAIVALSLALASGCATSGLGNPDGRSSLRDHARSDRR
jgi:hypothetical protein